MADRSVLLTAGVRSCLLLGLCLMVGCDAKGAGSKSVGTAPQRPGPAVAALKNHFAAAATTGKGWRVTDVVQQDNSACILVAVPKEQAAELMKRPAEEQFRQVAQEVCPQPAAPVWQVLPAGSGIKVLPTLDGQVFIEVDCRR